MIGQAVDETRRLRKPRRRALHAKVLEALAAHAGEPVELARLVHHAAGAGDGAAVLRYAPEAARRASALDAHREAAAHYRTALERAEGISAGERARLYEALSYECYLTDRADDAVEALEGAIACYRMLGAAVLEGDALRSLSSVLWCPGRSAEARTAGLAAVALLQTQLRGPELVEAYSNMAFLCRAANEDDEAARWQENALELATTL